VPWSERTRSSSSTILTWIRCCSRFNKWGIHRRC
jgi:hypothetical protein